MTRVDLDALEKIARAMLDCVVTGGGPQVMLAMVARVRDLEAALVEAIDILHGEGFNTCDFRSVRDRGVVIP